ncbi:AMIN domain-containing protein [Sulfurimonas aquatica]|uniref:AMIN domain-containing protein n=1 Tax=Sulfurimonas aquatica TaxID=2672570 RepID=A0A975B282_9BACT|nr:AMIN domain-containing protein [Sulfurimonas aquatica]QSZ42886.1 AMIN domain-containing protein [Sulfurimonas aquatica]
MIKFLTIFSLMIFSLYARENPFFPIENEIDIPMTSNQTRFVEPLKRASYTLPSTAREIQSITIRYKNLDGSIVDKKEILNNSIDWHLPIFISQNYNSSESTTSNSLNKITSSKNKAKKTKAIKLISLKFLNLSLDNKRIKIMTNDKMIRNFLLTKPHRIVCDFKREIDIRSYEKELSSSGIVTKVKVGNHNEFYRVVMELDGYYRYTSKELKNGYLLTLQ